MTTNEQFLCLERYSLPPPHPADAGDDQCPEQKSLDHGQRSGVPYQGITEFLHFHIKRRLAIELASCLFVVERLAATKLLIPLLPLSHDNLSPL